MQLFGFANLFYDFLIFRLPDIQGMDVLSEYLATGLEERMIGLLMLSPEERYLELVTEIK